MSTSCIGPRSEARPGTAIRSSTGTLPYVCLPDSQIALQGEPEYPTLGDSGLCLFGDCTRITLLEGGLISVPIDAAAVMT